MATTLKRTAKWYADHLAAINEKLMAVAIEECDPDNWTAADVPIKRRSLKDNTARAAEKKSASITIGIIGKSMTIVDVCMRKHAGEKVGTKFEDSDDLAAAVAAAERKANDAVSKAIKEGKMH